MSNRFHNKYHRHNHHTSPVGDPRYPDAANDPIASYTSPFLGDFVLSGNLVLSGGATFTNPISTAAFTTFLTTVSTSGEFLLVNINGAPRAIRLWQY